MPNDKSIFADLNAPYYIYSPDFRENSAGVRALHYLCHALNLIGEEAYVLTDIVSGNLRTPTLSTQIRERHIASGREPIVVYPEIFADNPLMAKNVVRYILNTPGFLTKVEPSWQPTDLLFTVSSYFLPTGMNAELLEIPLSDQRIYNANGVDDESRHGTLAFIHRYLDRGGELLPITADSTEISYRVPSRSPQELADLYRHAELMYAYDFSAACYEAMLCGCPVVYLLNELTMPKHFEGHSGSDGTAWGTDAALIAEAKRTVHRVAESYHQRELRFWKQLDTFVAKTQAHAKANTAPLTPQTTMSLDSELNSAIHQFQTGNHDAAFEALLRCIEINPEEPLIYLYLALISALKELPEESASFIEQALLLAPTRHDYLATLGATFLQTPNIGEALKYLQEAVRRQPNMFEAYPPLAQALSLNGQTDAAIELLQVAAACPSEAQPKIQACLIEILSKRGDISTLAEICLKARNPSQLLGLGIRLLTRLEVGKDRVRNEVLSFSHKHTSVTTDRKLIAARDPRGQLSIAFLVSDFHAESLSGRLESLLLNLPSEKFRTIVIDDDPLSSLNEMADRCYLISDHHCFAVEMDDATLERNLMKLSTDILIDLNGMGPRYRIGLLNRVPVTLVASWSDIPNWGQHDVAIVSGSRQLPTGCVNQFSSIVLEGLGELWNLPSVEIAPKSGSGPTRFGCLSAANKISSSSWHQFAKLLASLPESTLCINLAELEAPAVNFIEGIFLAEGVLSTRLIFIHATTVDALCEACNAIDLGLAPLYGNGDIALNCCLWMNTPFVAQHSDDLWSQRPATLLRAFSLDDFVAATPEDFLRIARRASAKPMSFELRHRVQESSLSDPRQFTQNFANAISQAYAAKVQ